MKIAIAGGTGLIGKALTDYLHKSGHEVIILTRQKPASPTSKDARYISWLNKDSSAIVEELTGVDAFINLAGSTINTRWTDKGKEQIVESRIHMVEILYSIIGDLPVKPKVFINASAVGFYGTSEKQIFTESSRIAGPDFLAQTVVQWESAAKKIESMGIRTVYCRFGVVLDSHGGALPRMVLPYHLFIGGTIGNGHQWLSWIHIQDVVRGILFVIEHADVRGPVNFTAPEPVQMQEFGKTLATVLNKPHWFPVPSFALKILLGEMSLLVLEGQKVLPKALLDHGFSFHYPHLRLALEEIF
ncbi:TIGR01777 family oxidoreductase [Mesobacillus maritimus]|uniref:TIGR01777 family protein n=1 Tax=Mesobacillus maritimus TaxID=1643336 RepID=A0ABS7K7D7_9BACI|nr:TIGR01777 family oxidoreductase [Mesobacillus maritimus]MBY0098025.1 TIGR01777 family protein [Mesobacillus maritimus]